jgi:glycosyltransferase involved in cell wall biosynthesis
MPGTKPTLSVAIISFNEEVLIAQCIENVTAIADEIIVVDSGSSDKTVEIATNLGAKVFCEEWKGFAEQRNSARDKCSGEWVLFVDCDEVLSEEVRSNILLAIAQDRYCGYQLKSFSFFMGKWIKHSWREDWHTKLARRDRCRWTGLVHEDLVCGGSIGKVYGRVHHFTYSSYEKVLAKNIHYAKLGAQSLCNQHKAIRASHIVLNPLWRFIKHYFINLGFLDGFQGFVIAITNLHCTFCKYLFAWEMQHREACNKPDIPVK